MSGDTAIIVLKIPKQSVIADLEIPLDISDN